MRGPGRMSPGYTGRARWEARVVLLTAANRGRQKRLSALEQRQFPSRTNTIFKQNERTNQP